MEINISAFVFVSHSGYRYRFCLDPYSDIVQIVSVYLTTRDSFLYSDLVVINHRYPNLSKYECESRLFLLMCTSFDMALVQVL